MVIRDLTLRSAASFGSFHLIRLLYDEYMYYLVEHRVAQAKAVTPIAVMGEVCVLSTSGHLFLFLLRSSPSKLLDDAFTNGRSSLCCSLPVASRAGSLQTWRKVSLPRNATKSSLRCLFLT